MHLSESDHGQTTPKRSRQALDAFAQLNPAKDVDH